MDDALGALIRIRRMIDECNLHQNEWEGISSPYFCNAGKIEAGIWPGAVPERCILQLQIGFPPPVRPVDMVSAVQAVLNILEKEESCNCTLRVGSLQVMPFANRGNKMVTCVSESIARLRPDEMEVKTVAVSGHCDLFHLRKVDGSISDACLYGPGGGANPHARDEFYMLDHFIPVAENIASSVLSYVGMI